MALVGVDKYIMKQETITDNDKAHYIRVMRYSVSPEFITTNIIDYEETPKFRLGNQP